MICVLNVAMSKESTTGFIIIIFVMFVSCRRLCSVRCPPNFIHLLLGKQTIAQQSSALDKKALYKASWFTLSGASRFCHRNDLYSAVGKDITRVLEVDPLLDGQYFPIGLYSLKLQTSDANQLQSKFESSDSKFRLRKGRSSQLNPASSKNITSCSVRLGEIPANMDLEKVMYWLEKYQLSTKEGNVTLLGSSSHGTLNYLVHFASEVEAQRFVTSHENTSLENNTLSVIHYHC